MENPVGTDGYRGAARVLAGNDSIKFTHQRLRVEARSRQKHQRTNDSGMLRSMEPLTFGRVANCPSVNAQAIATHALRGHEKFDRYD